MELKDELKLSKDNLHFKALRQPSLYFEWAEKWATAVKIRDKIKEQLSIAISDASLDIRANPEKYGGDNKVTEAFITSRVPKHPEVKRLNDELIEAQYNVNLYDGAKKSIDHMGSRLDTLSKMFASGYFSSGKNQELKDQAIEESMEEQERAANEDRKPTLRKK